MIKMIVKSSPFIWNDELCSICLKSKLNMFILIFKNYLSSQTNVRHGVWGTRMKLSNLIIVIMCTTKINHLNMIDSDYIVTFDDVNNN